jgi:hypothetical protein
MCGRDSQPSFVPRLSRWVFVDRAHGIDSTRSQTFAQRSGHEQEINAMRHENSVFHSILKHVPSAEFDRLVGEHGADALVRRLTTKSQFVALVYGQLAGASSLCQLKSELASHDVRLYHVGAKPGRRATLSDANAQRPSAVFSELFARLDRQAHRALRRKVADTTYLIDSTTVRLNGLSQ